MLICQTFYLIKIFGGNRCVLKAMIPDGMIHSIGPKESIKYLHYAFI